MSVGARLALGKGDLGWTLDAREKSIPPW